MTVYVLYLYFHKYLSCFKLEGFIFSIVFLGLFFIVALLKINNKVVITARIKIWFNKIKVIITMLILALPTIKLLQAIYCIQKVAKVKKEAHKTE